MFKKWKGEPWFPFFASACGAVLLWFILSNLGSIANVFVIILKACVPVIGGFVIAFILDPVVKFINRTVFRKFKTSNIARYVSILLTLAIVFALFSILVVTLIPEIYHSIVGIFGKLKIYEATLLEWVSQFDFKTTDINTAIDSMFTNIANVLPVIIDWLMKSYSHIGGLVANIVISVIMAVYFLFGKKRIISGFRSFFKANMSKKHFEPCARFFKRCNQILITYVTGSIIEALAVGVVNAILMSIFRMPYVVLVSVVVGITNLAPTFGPLVGGVIGAALLFLEKPIYALIFIIFTIAIQTVDGYVVKPKMFGETLGVSSIWILITIVVFGKLFGFLGLIIAIPFAAIVQILLRDIFRRRQERKKNLSKTEISPEISAADSGADVVTDSSSSIKASDDNIHSEIIKEINETKEL